MRKLFLQYLGIMQKLVSSTLSSSLILKQAPTQHLSKLANSLWGVSVYIVLQVCFLFPKFISKRIFWSRLSVAILSWDPDSLLFLSLIHSLFKTPVQSCLQNVLDYIIINEIIYNNHKALTPPAYNGPELSFTQFIHVL